jgi:hypothetical protein
LFSSLDEKFLGTVALSFVFGNYCPTMDSKDLSRKLQANYAISYFFYLYLMLHAYAARFDVIGNLEKFLNFGLTIQGLSILLSLFIACPCLFWTEKALMLLIALLLTELLCCSADGDFSAVDMAYALTTGAGNFEVTPENLRSVLPLINWDKISAMYLPGRSGAECESRYFCSPHFFFCS